MTDREADARLFHHARREAIVVAVVWLLALLWTVGYSYVRGYDHPPDSWPVRAGLAVPRSATDMHLIFGFPDWVVFGVLAPWLACTVFTVAFALVGMTDDALGAEAEEGGADGPAAV